MKISRVLVALVAVAGMMLASISPVSARTRTATDPRGDARPAIDLVRAIFGNNANLATARIKVRDLRWRGSFSLALYTYDAEEGYFLITLRARRDHTTRTTYGVMSRGGFAPGGCHGGVTARYRPRKDIVSFSVRRSCIPQIRRHPMIDFEGATMIRSTGGAARASDDVRKRVWNHR